MGRQDQTPASSDVSAGPSLAAGSNMGLPMDTVFERMAELMARQNEAFLLTLAAQQKITQDTSQMMATAINNLTEKVVLFSKDRTKDSKDRAPVRKKNPFPHLFAASNGEDEASAGEGNASSKDVNHQGGGDLLQC